MSSPNNILAIFSLKWCIFASFMSFIFDINLKNVPKKNILAIFSLKWCNFASFIIIFLSDIHLKNVNLDDLGGGRTPRPPPWSRQ